MVIHRVYLTSGIEISYYRYMIKKNTFLVCLLLLTIWHHTHAQLLTTPKREFRGAWICTVSNLDWPSSPGLSSDEQKRQLLRILDSLHNTGINAVMFQVRPTADAFYGNGKELWSRYLTGKQGQAPVPFYDPLSFAITEAHRRGMELHAWFNPYRASLDLLPSHFHPNHITNLKPEWFFNYAGQKIFNPGLPEVRSYIISVIMEIVRNYDIDGVHFDDYFYPDQISGKPLPDNDTYRKYGSDSLSIKDWRRQNVDVLIHDLNDSIHTCKSYVKFGISPFGVWKNKFQDSVGSPTNGGSSFYELYADTRKWMMNGWIDYINPQLYWPIKHRLVPFEKLMDWWSNNTYGRHLYIGQAAYRAMENVQGFRDRGELSNEIRFIRSNARIQGSVFFRSMSLVNNLAGIKDSLQMIFYNRPALVPVMLWRDSIAPNPPINPIAVRLNDQSVQITWSTPLKAKDNENVYGYVIYRFNEGEKIQIDNPKNIINISFDSSITTFVDKNVSSSQSYTYVVTALDRLKNESDLSQTPPVHMINSPPVVVENQ